MTIYTDAAGNKYIGDCRWGNHDINNPTFNYLLSRTPAGMNADMDLLLSSTGGTYSDVLSESDFNEMPINTTLFRWTPVGDNTANSTTKRFRVSSNGGVSGFTIQVFDDNGNEINKYISSASSSNYWSDAGESAVYPYLPAQFVVFGSPSLVVFTSVIYRPIPSSINVSTVILGRIEDSTLNTNFGYYTNSPLNRLFYANRSNSFNSFSTITFKHIISGGAKNILNSGRSIYNISCSDGQLPGSQWATDMWVYDNNAALGYPVIGRVPNMLLGIGTYTYLKPVKIEGSVFPDNGSPWYLPVGFFAEKTLLMRCYSSVS